MMKYSKYKSSGIKWLGDIPEHWVVKRFKYCFNNGKGLSITKSDLLEKGIPCVSYGEIHSKFGFEVDPDKNTLLYVNEEYLETNKSSLLKYGDFVFADTSEDIEGAGNFTHLASEKKVFAGYHTVICRLSIKSNPRFFAYAIDSISFRTQIRRKVQGVKVYSITNKILKDTILWFPEIKEQTAIANYLDEKTSKLDLLISNKKEQIKRLKEIRQIEINTAVTKGLDPNVKLKPSGVEWLGNIPEHWKKVTLKYLIDVRDGTHDTPEYIDNIAEGFPLVTSKDVSNGKLDFDKCKYIAKKDHDEIIKRSNVEFGDLIMPMIGTVGSPVKVSTKKAFSIKNLALFKKNSNVNIDYLCYVLGSNIVETQFDLKASGGVQGFVALGTLRNLKVLRIPVKEQTSIANYLDEKTSKIDKLKSNLKNQLNQLQEIRKIEIYNAVTGKIKVV